MKSNRRRNRTLNQRAGAVPTRRLWKEITGIVLLTLTALMILALISFHADDPPSASSSASSEIHNYIGSWGAYLAYNLVLFFGTSVVLVPFITFYLGYAFIIPARDRRWRRLTRLAGAGVLVLIIATSDAVFLAQDLVFGTQSPRGGVLGEALGRILLPLLGRPGCGIILAALGVIGMILVTGLTLREILSTLRRFLARSLELFNEWWATIRKPAEDSFGPGPGPGPVGPPKRPRRPKIGKDVIVEPAAQIKIMPPAPAPPQTTFDFVAEGGFKLPPLTLLKLPDQAGKTISEDTLRSNSLILEKKLKDFGIDGQVTHVHPGPVITMYEYSPAPGVKVNRIVSLSDDLAMAMSAFSVRVVAPIPGKAAVGIEIPNVERETVHLLEILTSDEMKKSKSKLAFALGKDIAGHPVGGDLIRMPHLLIAGATGTGKSVMLNTLICSILFRATPADVRFLMIDPKMVELTAYEEIPHLIAPVVTSPKKASAALKNVIRVMEGRYQLLAERNAKNIESYNHLMKAAADEPGNEPMPYLVVVIDELADLMIMAAADVEESIIRLAQMARAVGIHLVLATQRPSVNVITGVIKANLPSRISFQVSSKIDSRVILDGNGAEQLLGKGDMLFLPPGTSKLRRVHGAFISENEIHSVVTFLRKQAKPAYDDEILRPVEETDEADAEAAEASDEMYRQAVEMVRRSQQVSISMIQRKLRVGYNRAARMVEMMEKEGIIGPADGVRPRRILPPQ